MKAMILGVLLLLDGREVTSLVPQTSGPEFETTCCQTSSGMNINYRYYALMWNNPKLLMAYLTDYKMY